MRSLAVLLLATLPLAAVEYPLTPDSERQPGVPQGKIEHLEHTCRIFPGTKRGVWVYVPAQYTGDEPAPVMIFQDGGRMHQSQGDNAWRTPIVLDNLIHQKAMPVTIGIFIDPGVMPAAGEDQRERYNRSYEYDGLGDRYARFLLEEILPEVGKKYNLTDDPNLRGIGGSSSGGIAAFTAAWERPDAFRRVLMFVGSFTNLRGGDTYPGLIRKTEPKPLKVFMQDGKNDLNIYSGAWWIANQDVHSALEFAGYDVNFVRGEEGHNNKHGRAILPQGLRWLWSDWQEPIEANRNKTGDRQWVLEFIDPASDWELVSEGHDLTEGPAIAPNGDFYFTDIRQSKIWKLDAQTEKLSVFKENTGRTNGLMFSRDGTLYSCRSDAIVAIDVETGEERVVVADVRPNDVAVTPGGGLYFTEFSRGKVWYVSPSGEQRLLDTPGIEKPNGVLLSPDPSLLFVADYGARWVWSYQIQPDGTIANGQPFYHLEVGDYSSASHADGMTVTEDGYLFVATNKGVQICDQPGRVIGILSTPNAGPFTNVVFAGPDMQTLYLTAGDKVFRRHMRKKGVRTWESATPPKPRL